jgi:ribosomal protein L37AE/L43A
MASHIEEAKSGRASCRTCKKTIAKGDLRLGVEAPNAFGDAPSLQWHHLLCAAGKLPAELKEAMGSFVGELPSRAELEQAMADAYAKGSAKPGGFPYVDRAPTGRAKCMECGEPIAKDSFRVAVEREIDVGASAQRGAGYLHPACVGANLENIGGSKDDTIEQLRRNSRIAAADLEAVIVAVKGP